MIIWLTLLLETLENMCISVLCFPGCDVINFKSNLIFLIRLLFPKSQNKNSNIFRTITGFKKWTNVTSACFRKIWRSTLQSFSVIISFLNYRYFLGVKGSSYVGCTKTHTISCKRIETTHTWSRLEKIKMFTFFIVLSLAGSTTLTKFLAVIYAQFVFSKVLSLHSIVRKHRPCCWYFRLKLKCLGWPYRAYIKTAKNGDFC